MEKSNLSKFENAVKVAMNVHKIKSNITDEDVKFYAKEIYDTITEERKNN